MLSFVTTTLINSKYDESNKQTVDISGNILPGYDAAAQKGYKYYVDRAGRFTVYGTGSFDAKNVKAIYKRAYSAPVFADAKINFSSLVPSDSNNTAGDYRVVIYVRLSQENTNAYYSNALVFKGKPFCIEFDIQKGDTAATISKRLERNSRRYLSLMYETPMLKVSADPAAGTVDIQGTDEYQLFHTVALQKYNTEAKSYDGVSYIGEFQDIDAGLSLVKQGKPGFGTFQQISKDLRLPTPANTNFLAPNEGEMPVPFATYDEYVIDMQVNRGQMGTGAVGAMVTSETTHVFIVNTDVSADFEAKILKIAPSQGIEVVDKDLDDKTLNNLGKTLDDADDQSVIDAQHGKDVNTMVTAPGT